MMFKMINFYKMFCLYFLRWPVRTISFNHTGDYIASASEDLFIDIVCALKLCSDPDQ